MRSAGWSGPPPVATPAPPPSRGGLDAILRRLRAIDALRDREAQERPDGERCKAAGRRADAGICSRQRLRARADRVSRSCARSTPRASPSPTSICFRCGVMLNVLDALAHRPPGPAGDPRRVPQRLDVDAPRRHGARPRSSIRSGARRTGARGIPLSGVFVCFSPASPSSRSTSSPIVSQRRAPITWSSGSTSRRCRSRGARATDPSSPRCSRCVFWAKRCGCRWIGSASRRTSCSSTPRWLGSGASRRGSRSRSSRRAACAPGGPPPNGCKREAACRKDSPISSCTSIDDASSSSCPGHPSGRPSGSRVGGTSGARRGRPRSSRIAGPARDARSLSRSRDSRARLHHPDQRRAPRGPRLARSRGPRPKHRERAPGGPRERGLAARPPRSAARRGLLRRGRTPRRGRAPRRAADRRASASRRPCWRRAPDVDAVRRRPPLRGAAGGAGLDPIRRVCDACARSKSSAISRRRGGPMLSDPGSKWRAAARLLGFAAGSACALVVTALAILRVPRCRGPAPHPTSTSTR